MIWIREKSVHFVVLEAKLFTELGARELNRRLQTSIDCKIKRKRLDNRINTAGSTSIIATKQQHNLFVNLICSSETILVWGKAGGFFCTKKIELNSF